MVASDTFYFIRPSHCERQIVNVEGQAQTRRAFIIQWTDAVQKHGQWMFFPTDQPGEYYIAARHSGKIASIYDDGLSNALRQYEFFEDPKDFCLQKFLVKETREGYYAIHAQRWNDDRGVWDVMRESTLNGELLFIYDNHSGANQIFRLEAHEEVTVPTPRQSSVKPYEIGPPPGLTSIDMSPPPESEPVLIGESLVPYFLVKEAAGAWSGTAYQIEHSPYYVLSRFQLWKLVRSYVHDGRSTYEYEVERTTGFSEEKSQSIEHTISLTLAAEGEFLLKPHTLILKPSLEYSLKVTTTTTSQHYSEEKVRHKFSLPAVRMRHALWQMVDRYELRRANGEIVKSWDDLPQTYYHADAFPPVVS
jgi:hypothetical protein